MAQKEINNYMNACPIQECGQRGRGQGLLQQECQRYVFQPFLNFHFFINNVTNLWLYHIVKIFQLFFNQQLNEIKNIMTI